MARNDIPNGWDKIRQNVQETERLMGQKQYNQSMIKVNRPWNTWLSSNVNRRGSWKAPWTL